MNSYASSLSASAIPKLGAWRTLFTDIQDGVATSSADSATSSTVTVTTPIETDEIRSNPPPLRDYLSGEKSLSKEHEAKVMELWNIVKNKGTMRYEPNNFFAKIGYDIYVCYEGI